MGPFFASQFQAFVDGLPAGKVTKEIMSRYFFADFVFDSENDELIRASSKTKLQPKISRLLEHFLTSPGKVFSKAELLDLLWEDVAVAEGSLYQCISDTRTLLKDDPKSPTFIKNVPRHGYKWIYSDIERNDEGNGSVDARPEHQGTTGVVGRQDSEHPLRESENPLVDQAIPSNSAKSLTEHNRWRRSLFWVGVTLGALVVSVIWVGWRSESPGAADQKHRVAVFPFLNATGDPEKKWVELGFMDSVSTNLARVKDVSVIGTRHVLDFIDKSGIVAGKSQPGQMARALRELGPSDIITATVHEENSRMWATFQIWRGATQVEKGRVEGGSLHELIEILHIELLRAFGKSDFELGVFAGPFQNEAFAKGRESIIKGQPGQALPYFQICLEQDPHSPRVKLELGRCKLLAQGDFENSLRLLEEALATFEENDDSLHQADCLQLLARIALHRGNVDKFEALFAKAIQHQSQLGQEDAALEFSLWFGKLALSHGKMDWAESTAQRVLSQVRSLGLPHLETQASFLLGRCRLARGDHEQALIHFEKAIQLLHKLGSSNREILALEYLPDLGIVGDQHELHSLSLFDRAVRVAAGQSEHDNKSLTLKLFAFFHYRAENWDQARDYFSQLKDLYASRGNQLAQAESELYLSLVNLDRRRFQEAQTWFDHALELCEEIGQIEPVASLSYYWGTKVHHLRLFDSSENALRKALSMHRRLDSRQGELYDRIMLAAVLVDCGKWVKAAAQIEAIFELSELQSDNSGMLWGKALLGELELVRGNLEEVKEILHFLDQSEHTIQAFRHAALFLPVLRIKLSFEQGNWDRAAELIDQLDRNTSIGPQHQIWFHIFSGLLAMEQGDSQGAEAHLMESFNSDLADYCVFYRSIAAYYLADFYRSQGMWDKGRPISEIAEKTSPHGYEPLLLAAQYADHFGQRGNAVALGQKAKEEAHLAWTQEMEAVLNGISARRVSENRH